jgi:hypothetical protein
MPIGADGACDRGGSAGRRGCSCLRILIEWIRGAREPLGTGSSAAGFSPSRESDMRLTSSMTRILIALIVLRVLAAPISARPDLPKAPSDARFIVRVCAWPAQRAQRLSASASLVSRFSGRGAWVSRPSAPSYPRLASLWTLGRLSLRLPPFYRDPSALRLLDSPRC